MYSFGRRRLVGQWIIAVDPARSGPSLIRPGDSGVAWTTEDGVVVGLQVGIVSGRLYRAIVTPFQTISEVMEVRVAA